ncbi:MAG: DUF362 domain-containing protein [Candidatus Hodarchaeales archaeon]|jgi:uncharacterized protein (DUF362 family)
MKLTEVFLIRSKNRKEGIERILSHFDDKIQALKGKNVVIKPNFNTADPPPASTDITLIRELITRLKHAGKVTVIERSGPVNTHETMKKIGIFKLQKEVGGFEIVNLSEPETDWILINNEMTTHWKKGFLFSKLIQEADAIIELPCMKTHQYGGHFTLSLKLAVGLVPRDGYEYMKELHNSPHQRKMIAEINTAFDPTLIILDGVDAFVDGGPDKGTLKHPDVMLASTDRIAIDAVSVAILRYLGTTPNVQKGLIFQQEQIKRAVELNLGVTSPTEIEITSDNSDSEEFINLISEILLN